MAPTHCIYPTAFRFLPSVLCQHFVNDTTYRSPSPQVLNVNLKSVWLLSQAAGRHMVPLRRGKIVNFCSLLTYQGGLTVPAYAAAKGALGQVTKALSNEWSKENVQVNGIVPGYIATDMYVPFPSD